MSSSSCRTQRNSPAARAGLLAGDRIVEIMGQPISDGEGMVKIIYKSAGKPLALEVEAANRPSRDRTPLEPCPIEIS